MWGGLWEDEKSRDAPLRKIGFRARTRPYYILLIQSSTRATCVAQWPVVGSTSSQSSLSLLSFFSRNAFKFATFQPFQAYIIPCIRKRSAIKIFNFQKFNSVFKFPILRFGSTIVNFTNLKRFTTHSDSMIPRAPENELSKKYNSWFGFSIENILYFLYFSPKKKLITKTTPRANTEKYFRVHYVCKKMSEKCIYP